jgi:hypothetical protein
MGKGADAGLKRKGLKRSPSMLERLGSMKEALQAQEKIRSMKQVSPAN